MQVFRRHAIQRPFLDDNHHLSEESHLAAGDFLIHFVESTYRQLLRSGDDAASLEARVDAMHMPFLIDNLAQGQ